MKVLITYVDRTPLAQFVTLSRMARKIYEELGWDVYDQKCVDDYDYGKFIARHWGGHDIIIIEHDMVFDIDILRKLARCPNPLCVQAYPSPFDRNIRGRRELMHRDTEGNWKLVPAKWADRIGFGLAKITTSIQEAIPATSFFDTPWYHLDTAFSERLVTQGIKAHIHYPVIKHLQLLNKVNLEANNC